MRENTYFISAAKSGNYLTITSNMVLEAMSKRPLLEKLGSDIVGRSTNNRAETAQ